MKCDRRCVFDASHPTPHISIHVTMLRGRRMGKFYNKALSYNFQSTSLLRGMKLVIRGQVIACVYLYNKGMLFIGIMSLESSMHWYMMKTVHFTAL